MARIRGLAERLNLVQRERGYRKSMRAFREALLDPDFWKSREERPPSFSAEAMRHYHLRREPPSSYLMAVAARFDVNPAWLLSGEGLPFMEDVRQAQSASLGEADHPLWPPALSGVPELAGWPTPAKVLFLDVLGYYAWSFEGWASEVWEKESEQRRFEAIEALARDLFEQVNVSYHSMREGLTRRAFTQYLVALIHAVQLRIPDAGEGPHIFYRFETLDPEYRAGLREKFKDVPDAESYRIMDFDRPLTEVQPSAWGERHKKKPPPAV